MTYERINFVDQSVERPRTYEMTHNADGSVTLVDSFGLVDELGTPINADTMNHLEDGIAAAAIRKYSLNETYALGEWVLATVENETNFYKSLKDNNLGNPLADTNYWEVVKIGSGGNGHELFDVVLKDHILSYEEKQGYELLGNYVYKEAVAGSRYGYPDFYNKCIEEYENSVETEQYLSSNVAKTGYVVDRKGVISGFSSSNYVGLPLFEPASNPWEIVVKANSGEDGAVRIILGAGITVDRLQIVCDALGITLKEFFDIDESPDDFLGAISNLTPKQKQLLMAFLKSL